MSFLIGKEFCAISKAHSLVVMCDDATRAALFISSVFSTRLDCRHRASIAQKNTPKQNMQIARRHVAAWRRRRHLGDIHSMPNASVQSPLRARSVLVHLSRLGGDDLLKRKLHQLRHRVGPLDRCGSPWVKCTYTSAQIYISKRFISKRIYISKREPKFPRC